MHIQLYLIQGWAARVARKPAHGFRGWPGEYSGVLFRALMRPFDLVGDRPTRSSLRSVCIALLQYYSGLWPCNQPPVLAAKQRTGGLLLGLLRTNTFGRFVG